MHYGKRGSRNRSTTKVRGTQEADTTSRNVATDRTREEIDDGNTREVVLKSAEPPPIKLLNERERLGQFIRGLLRRLAYRDRVHINTQYPSSGSADHEPFQERPQRHHGQAEN